MFGVSLSSCGSHFLGSRNEGKRYNQEFSHLHFSGDSRSFQQEMSQVSLGYGRSKGRRQSPGHRYHGAEENSLGPYGRNDPPHAAGALDEPFDLCFDRVFARTTGQHWDLRPRFLGSAGTSILVATADPFPVQVIRALSKFK